MPQNTTCPTCQHVAAAGAKWESVCPRSAVGSSNPTTPSATAASATAEHTAILYHPCRHSSVIWERVRVLRTDEECGRGRSKVACAAVGDRSPRAAALACSSARSSPLSPLYPEIQFTWTVRRGLQSRRNSSCEWNSSTRRRAYQELGLPLAVGDARAKPNAWHGHWSVSDAAYNSICRSVLVLREEKETSILLLPIFDPKCAEGFYAMMFEKLKLIMGARLGSVHANALFADAPDGEPVSGTNRDQRIGLEKYRETIMCGTKT